MSQYSHAEPWMLSITFPPYGTVMLLKASTDIKAVRNRKTKSDFVEYIATGKIKPRLKKQIAAIMQAENKITKGRLPSDKLFLNAVKKIGKDINFTGLKDKK
jgi:hypothetical protein